MKHILSLLIIVIALGGCRRSSEGGPVMDHVEAIIETYPDSALTLLRNLDPSQLSGGEEKAHYALLMSMALDKNYIDTTTFEILQPAIDRYLSSGSPDLKLRTLYYQGCIYLNRKDYDNAMICFLNASDLTGVKDSLVLARLHQAKSVIYDKLIDVPHFTEEQLMAADIYRNVGKNFLAAKSYIKAFNGALMKDDKQLADSLLNICRQMVEIAPEAQEYLDPSYITYITYYCDKEEIRRMLTAYNDYIYLDPPLKDNDVILNMALGYAKIGEPEKSFRIFEHVDSNIKESTFQKLQLIRWETYKAAGDYRGAYDSFMKYYHIEDSLHYHLFTHDLIFADKKHKLEVANLKELQKRNNMIWGAVFMIVILIVLTFMIYYRYRLSLAQKAIISGENAKLQLERENLRYEMSRLEDERDRLTQMLDSREQMAQPLRNALAERLDVLNSILAKELTDRDSYAKPYHEWIDSARKNRTEFMNKTREAFSLSNPEFIAHLRSCDLTDDEINVACLYAIGLRGKDVGEYLQIKSHYNVSSSIRKKLGISTHDTNLNLYIRSLLNRR